MMLFIEFQNFDTETLVYMNRKMRAASIQGDRWFEWSPALGALCEQPDLTLIGSQRLSRGEVALLANASRGQQVVLVGDCQFTLGLPLLPRDFAMHELLGFIPWWGKQDQTCQPCTVPMPPR